MMKMQPAHCWTQGRVLDSQETKRGGEMRTQGNKKTSSIAKKSAVGRE